MPDQQLTAFDNGSSYTQNIFTGTATFDQDQTAATTSSRITVYQWRVNISVSQLCGRAVSNTCSRHGMPTPFRRNTHTFNEVNHLPCGNRQQ